MDASINSNTPVTEYLRMPIYRFHEIWQALCAVNKRRAREMKEQMQRKRQGRRRT